MFKQRMKQSMWDALEWERRCGNPAAQERGSKGNINFENEACRICLYLREKIWWGFPKFSLLCRNLISGRRGAVGGKIESGLRKGWFYWEKKKLFFIQVRTNLILTDFNLPLSTIRYRFDTTVKINMMETGNYQI